MIWADRAAGTVEQCAMSTAQQPQVEFRDKFIAFIDVLGFENRVKSAEAGAGMTLPQLLTLLEQLGSVDERDHFAEYGPIICPAASYLRRDLDFQFTQISDCAVLSAEVSPAGVINLVDQCSKAVFRLLKAGALCRGAITRGSIYHTGRQFVGTGYVEALKAEKAVAFRLRNEVEKSTPFVEVGGSVVAYIAGCEDTCVQEMFERMVERDGGTAVLFPFKRLSPSFYGIAISSARDIEQARMSNQAVRHSVERLIAGRRRRSTRQSHPSAAG